MAATKREAKKKKTVVFFHPDLGIGGAERLVVDAAVGLQARGHRVVIFTSHCDPAHCFDEVRPGSAPDGQGGALLDVRVRGGHVVPPTLLGGRFAILCAIARQLHLLLHIWWTGELVALGATAYFVDQLAAGLPLLRWVVRGGGGRRGAQRVPILFYCHFPDLLLATGREHWWKRLYRVPFDALEQWSMGCADVVAVNSRFTQGVAAATWPPLGGGLRVVYPCVTAAADDDGDDGDDTNGGSSTKKGKRGKKNNKTDRSDDGGPLSLWNDVPFLLSINRFERKKNIGLAIRAFAGLPTSLRDGTRLVIAGGYDTRVAENVEHHRELDQLAADLGLRAATAATMVTALAVPADIQVLFLPSVPAALKTLLLHAPNCRLLVYTPAHEHFGIVPVEAMLAGLPVLACDSGGPTETVVDGETGWLRPADDVVASVLPSPSSPSSSTTGLPPAKRAAMAAAGRSRARTQFSDAQMAARLEALLDEIEVAAAGQTVPPIGTVLLACACLFGVLALALGALVWKRVF
ncbi:alpha-mannosyltransferase [Niveomyces insectorum RCEF 264]|uniref:Alpha-1,3/1,6-mannosyltransferase ALG2 n=1 Tax=Niveomyces insectorum RCEF 264 TaxID=1081102 RepID=A0A167QFX9_9HYPO|nr:alpha-mannosyltransferase [Niveomyces insectorum RCEF 264]